MPPIPKRHKPDQINEAYEVSPADDAEWAEFTAVMAWKRSRRGNLWRTWYGRTCTIFRREGDDLYHWCLATGDETWFSRGGFVDEYEAIESLADRLGLGI